MAAQHREPHSALPSGLPSHRQRAGEMLLEKAATTPPEPQATRLAKSSIHSSSASSLEMQTMATLPLVTLRLQ